MVSDGEEAESAFVPAWFDIKSPLPVSGQNNSFDGIGEAIKQVHNRLDELIQAMDLAPSRVVIGGFGQGGALAIAAGLAYRLPLAGILCHSGWVGLGLEIEGALDLSTCANKNAPLMMIHGNEDDFATLAYAREGAERLRRAGMREVIFKPFDGLEHKMRNDSANLTLDFLRARLPAVAPPPKKQGEEAAGAAPTGAKSKTVIKMNRRSAGSSAPAAPPAAPPEPPPPEPELEPVEPVDREEEEEEEAPSAPSATASSPAAPPAEKASSKAPSGGAKRTPAGPIDPGSISAHPATAKALREGDKDALERALAARGDDCPLSSEEMVAIAQLMLGADATNDFGRGLAQGLAQGPDAAMDFWRKEHQTQVKGGPTTTTTPAPTPPTQAKAKTARPPAPPAAQDEDSDDGEWTPDDVGSGGQSQGKKEADREAANGGAEPKAEPKAPLSAAEWESKAEEALARARGESVPAAATPAAATPAAATPAAATPAPKAAPSALPGDGLCTLTDEGSALRLVVRLPSSVSSMAQVEVDLSSERVVVNVDDAPYADVKLPRAVDEEQASAKFAKKSGELRVTAPLR